jgi:hypothetical protein
VERPRVDPRCTESNDIAQAEQSLAEVPRKLRLLLSRLQHGEAIHPSLDRRDILGREQSAQVDPRYLAEKSGGQSGSTTQMVTPWILPRAGALYACIAANRQHGVRHHRSGGTTSPI